MRGKNKSGLTALLSLGLTGCYVSPPANSLTTSSSIPDYVKRSCNYMQDEILQLAVEEIRGFEAMGYSRMQIQQAETQSCMQGFSATSGLSGLEGLDFCGECMGSLVDYALR